MEEILNLHKKINDYLEGSYTMFGNEILQYFIVSNQTNLQNIISKAIEQDENNKNTCGYQPGLKSAFYQCQDCQFSNNSLICQSCFKRENHLGHRVLIEYLKGQEGSCDCGDAQTLNEECFCDKHKLENNQMHNIEQNNNPVYKQIEQLLQVLFCELFNKLEKIADYPIGFSKLLKNLSQIKNDTINNFIEKAETQLNQINKIYQLLINFLSYILNQNSNNIPFVVDCLAKPIKADIQKVIGLHHSHQNQELHMKLEQQPEYCECTILKNWIRLNVIIDTCCNENPIHSDLIIKLFLKLFTVKFIKQLFCTAYDQLMLCNFREVIKSTYKLNQTQIVVQTNFINYYNYSIDILSPIVQFFSLKSHYTRKKLHRSSFENLLFALDQLIIKTFVINKNYIVQYPILKDMLERMPKTSNQTTQFYSQFRQLMLNRIDHYTIEATKNDLLESIDKSNGNYQKFKQLMSNSYIVKFYGNLIPTESIKNPSQSVKIQCILLQQLELLKLNFQILKLLLFSEIQQLNLRKYLVISLMQVIFDRMHNRKVLKQINNNNYINDVYTMTDKIFIILLSYYYYAEQSENLKDQLSEIFGYSQTIVKEEIEQLVQRNILNILIFNKPQISNYYKRQFRCYQKYQKGEQCQESIDFAMLQLYANIYEDGLIYILNYIESLDQLGNPQIINLIISRILAQDYDLLQTCGNLFDEELPLDLLKGFRQMIQSLFTAQNYYQFDQIEASLELNGHDEFIQIEKMICQFCRLDKQTGQLCLKSPFKPRFEPMSFMDFNKFEDIKSKLTETNQYETIIFGNALKYDLENQDQIECNNSNNMSRLRLTIIENNFINQQNLVSLVLLECEEIGIQALIKHKFIVYIHLLLSQVYQIQNNCLKSIINDSKSTDKTIQIFKQILNPIICQPQQSNPIVNNQKRNNLKDKYTKRQLQFEKDQSENLDQLISTDEQVCNHCNIHREDQQLFRLVKLTLSNIKQYIMINDFIKDISWFERYKQNEIQISTCVHQFHNKCLTQTKKKQMILYFCPICQITGNCILPVKYSPKDLQFINQQLFKFVCESSLLEHYYMKYFDDSEDMQTVFMDFEVLCQIYVGLIICQRYEQERFQKSNLQQILIIILQHMQIIKSEYLDKNGLDYLFYKEAGFVRDLLKQIFKENHPLPLQLEQNQEYHQYNQQLISYFKSKLNENYQQFYEQYYLNKCELCKKIPDCFDKQIDLYDQYLCLLCLKKYCIAGCDCGSKDIYHHANKYHNGNTVYIGILQTDIYIQNQGFHTKYKRQLYKNQIGRCPDIKQQKQLSDYSLDIQTLQELAEIIIVQNFRNIYLERVQYQF